MANELKPCPFCQTQPVVSENNVPGNWYAVAECDNRKCAERPVIYGDDETDAKTKWNNGDAWNTRPAAPVEGLETIEYMSPVRGGWVRNPVIAGGRAVVTRSQAEAIIAAERERADANFDKAIEQGKRVAELEADNAALAAQIEAQVEHIATLDSNLEAMEKRAQEGETQLAAANKRADELEAAWLKAEALLSEAALEAKP